MEMQWFASECEVRLADRLGLGRVRVNKLRYLGRQRLPVVDELAFGDELADPGTDQVDAEHRAAARGGNHLCRACGLQDHALSVGAQVVDELRDLDASLRGGR